MPFIAFVSLDETDSQVERRDSQNRIDDIANLLRSPTRENRLEAARLITIEDHVVQESVSEEATFIEVPVDRVATMQMRTEDGRTLGDLVALAPSL